MVEAVGACAAAVKGARSQPAPHGELEGLIGQLDEALDDEGLFPPARRAPQATKNTIRTIFTKTGWSSREVKAVRGIIRALVEPVPEPVENLTFGEPPPLGAPPSQLIPHAR